MSPLSDILNAINRSAAALDLQVERMGLDYSAEFPAEDARLLREAHALLAPPKVYMLPALDPMDAPLPCKVTIGHCSFGPGVALRALVDHAKQLYRLVHGRDADEVANEPLAVRQARGDAFLKSLQRGLPRA